MGIQFHLQQAVCEQKEKGTVMKENGVAKVPCGKLTHVTGCLSLRKNSLWAPYIINKHLKITKSKMKQSKPLNWPSDPY